MSELIQRKLCGLTRNERALVLEEYRRTRDLKIINEIIQKFRRSRLINQRSENCSKRISVDKIEK
jgi:hypothetical protein